MADHHREQCEDALVWLAYPSVFGGLSAILSMSMPACAVLLQPDVAIRKFFRGFAQFLRRIPTCNSFTARGLMKGNVELVVGIIR